MQEVVEAAGFSVVRSLVGHGVGREMHEDPQIPNYGDPGRGPRLEEGMVFAIEPMVNAGGHEVFVADDGWSISTVGRVAVGALRAHCGRGQEGAAGAHAPPLGEERRAGVARSREARPDGRRADAHGLFCGHSRLW